MLVVIRLNKRATYVQTCYIRTKVLQSYEVSEVHNAKG